MLLHFIAIIAFFIAIFNWIYLWFQLRGDYNFRLCCLKTIEHLATNIDLQDDSNNVHFSIIKHLFQRLFEVKWVENLDDLLLPSHQIKIEKQDIGFNVEKSILCLPETSQIVCHAQGGRGYCLGRCVFSTGGIYQWKFKILRCLYFYKEYNELKRKKFQFQMCVWVVA